MARGSESGMSRAATIRSTDAHELGGHQIPAIVILGITIAGRQLAIAAVVMIVVVAGGWWLLLRKRR